MRSRSGISFLANGATGSAAYSAHSDFSQIRQRRTNKSWRQQTLANAWRIASVFGLGGGERREIGKARAAPAVPNLTYLEDSQFEEEAASVEPGSAASQTAAAFAPAPQASAFAPKESMRLSLPRLPGSNAERHDQEYRLEETFRQRAAEIAATIARRHAPAGGTPARRPRQEQQAAPRRSRDANRSKFPRFELM